MYEGLVKVLLQHEKYVETLWADPAGPHLYRLDNSPFWAYGVSWNDVVEAHPDPDGMLRMTRVVEKAGHRTIRITFPADEADSPEAKAVLQAIQGLGATYEGMNPRYIAVDIPPGVDLMAVATMLTERGVEWEHADPEYSDLYPDKS